MVKQGTAEQTLMQEDSLQMKAGGAGSWEEYRAVSEDAGRQLGRLKPA